MATPQTLPEGSIIDPNLIDYLKHIKGCNKKYIQFSFPKIQEIVVNELEMDIQNFSEIVRRVTVQCFTFFLKNWPQYKLYSRNELPLADAYQSLKKFMRNKLMQIKLKEKAFTVDYKCNSIELPNVSFPDNINNMVSPYSVTIAAPTVKIPDLAFTPTKDGDMEIHLKTHANPVIKINVTNFLEYPFVSATFHIPGLIKMERSACTKFETFIQRSNISPVTSSNCETTTENVSPTAKVYSFNFFRNFFREFDTVCGKLGSEIQQGLRRQMCAFCSSILADIIDSNLCNKTVCEGAIITYNIGKSRFYCDTNITEDTDGEANLVFRKLLTPLTSYSVSYCSITQEDVQKKGLKCFAFRRNKDRVMENRFLLDIQGCLTYKCILCDRTLPSSDLKYHLMNVHPLDAIVTCTKCLKVIHMETLLRTRWRHTCNSK